MITIIIGALALALFQFWLLPASIDLKNLKYKISSRDEPLPETILQKRVKRAGDNLQESLAAFLALAILGVVMKVDMYNAALLWLVCRIVYVPCYMFNITYARSTIWLISIGCLIYMAANLI